MPFIEKFIITPNYIPKPSKRRSGTAANKVRFIVAHDTDNPKSTAAQNAHFFVSTPTLESVSAHLFVDDKEIIECVPALMSSPEKAWHVLYNVPKDNELFGVNANDASIGVEYCYGGAIDADKAYAKYVWVMAKLCFVFGLDPSKDIVGHFFLDPGRKTDPVSALAASRRTYDQMLRDVVTEYNECAGIAAPPDFDIDPQTGTLKVAVKLNVRKQPTRRSEIVQVLPANAVIDYTAVVKNGEPVNNNPIWYQDANGHYIWSGGVTATEAMAGLGGMLMSALTSMPSLPKLDFSNLDLPVNKNGCIKCAGWMEEHFADKFIAATADTHFNKNLLYAIACQETAIYWQLWIDDHTPEDILGRCVFDASGDVNGTRSAFPKNTAAFIEKFGQPTADDLIAEANLTRKMRGFSPRQWVYAGYGIFQYDLQFILTDKDFFIQKKWYSIDDCLAKAITELADKWAAHPNDLFNTVKAYNGSGPRAQNYALNVFQFLEWINAVV